MIGRADIEESKSYVVTNTKLPQASYPYGNFSNTSKKSIQIEDHLDMLSHNSKIPNLYVHNKITNLEKIL